MAKAEKSQKSNQTGVVRIIAGKHRGRKLPVLLAEGLRPTTDRVKETVFNWLMHDVLDSHCLDCFAGAGSLGFEALSRGAKSVTLVEKQANIARQLKSNIALLKAENAQVIQQDCLSYLSHSQQKFDLVFIDPPFRQGLVEHTASILEEKALLTANAKIYIECENNLTAQNLPLNWQLIKDKTAGQVSYRLYQRIVDYVSA